MSLTHSVDFAKKHDVGDPQRSEAEQLLAQLQKEVATVNQQVAMQDHNKRLQDKLQFIRLSHAGTNGNFDKNASPSQFNISQTGRVYRALFSESGLAIDKLSVPDAAKRIRDSDIAENWISAIDHWTSVLPTHETRKLAGQWMSVGNWKNARRLTARALQEDPNEPLHWLNLATTLAMLDDQRGYEKLCRDAMERFKHPVSIAESERITKVCLLMPTEIEIDLLPSKLFEQALDEGVYSSDDAEWYWATRSMLAYRKNDFVAAVKYAQTALDTADTNLGMPLPAALLALSQHKLGDTETAVNSLATLNELMQQLYQDSNPWTNSDGWIAQHFYRDASARIAPQTPAADPMESRSVQRGNLPESLAQERLRQRLLAIANLADKNAWRCEFRKAIVQEDETTIERLASSEAVSDQPAEIIAWLGATLRDQGDMETAARVLRGAQHNHPDDFWLNYELAECLLASVRRQLVLRFSDN